LKTGFNGNLQHFTVKEQEGTKSLILGRCGNIPVRNASTSVTAMSCGCFFTVEKKVLLESIQISLFSLIGMPFQAKGIADLFEEFFEFISTDIINYRVYYGVIYCQLYYSPVWC
jgi:hypothetical protein